MSSISAISPQYIAGLVDGEGCIGFSSAKQKRPTFIYPFLRVSMAHAHVLRAIQSQYGGHFYANSRDDRPSNAQCFSWYAQGMGILPRIIEQIWPHLIVKRDAAAAIIYAFPTYDASRRVPIKGLRGLHMIPEDKERRQEAYEWSRKINQTGPGGKAAAPEHMIAFAKQYFGSTS